MIKLWCHLFLLVVPWNRDNDCKNYKYICNLYLSVNCTYFSTGNVKNIQVIFQKFLYNCIRFVCADRHNGMISWLTNQTAQSFGYCSYQTLWVGESVALLVACRTNNRKVAGSRPTKVVCITVLTGNHLGRTVRCGRPPLLPSCRKLEFRLSEHWWTRIWHG